MSDEFLYIVIDGGEDLAGTISHGVKALAWPDGVAPEGTVATHAFGVLKHPMTGKVALEIPVSMTVALSGEVAPIDLLGILALLVDQNGLPMISAQETIQLLQLCGYFAGASVEAGWLVPGKALAEAKTWQDMTADGWWPPIGV